MSTTTNRPAAPRRAPALAGASLATALVLAACGGDDNDDTTDAATTEAPPATTEPAESESSDGTGQDDGGSETDSDAAPSDEGEAEAEASSRADEAASDADEAASDAGATSGEGTPGGIAPVSLVWPAEWMDLTDMLAPPPEGAEIEMVGSSGTLIYPAGVLTVYTAEFVDGRSYLELVEADGAPADALTEIEPREVAGQTVTPYEVDLTPYSFPAIQRIYPLELADGAMAGLTLTAPIEELEAAEPLFEAILDSVTIEE
ncbi:hypothetical protein ACPYO6_12340 [Georgenia sp. Z1344]|uniref:hypothetical protein n=1 Tax=Georgenia sp. Z1344 TaxID=3416706 RepID=UPI003CEA84B8